jgi:AraC-like DNA-binding protein
MRYVKYPPSKELLPFVECFYVWEGEATQEMKVQSPPNCFTAIVFNYGEPYEAYQGTAERTTVPKAFLCGLFTSNYHLVLKGKIGIVGIVFRPSAPHNFFGLRMSHLVNNRMELSLLLGDQAESLMESIKAQNDDAGRVELLSEFLLPQLAMAKSRLSIIDEAVDYIDHCHGGVTVEEVATHLRISRRYLEKRFLEKVGWSPKFYARVKRFVTLSKTVAYSKKFEWQDIVFENGLHDQSHLVKEFMKFNQMSPSEYAEKHHELIRFIRPE